MTTIDRPFALPIHRLAIAIAATLLLPALLLPTPVRAQDDFSLDEQEKPASNPDALADLTLTRSYAEFGIGTIDDPSFRFGRYRGLEEQGGFGVLNLGWFHRAAWNSDDPTYTQLVAHNAGLSTRRIEFEHGRQGDYRLRVNYTERSSFRSDSAQTPLLGVGTDHLTLPADWVGASTTAGMTRLLPSLNPVSLKQERRRFGIGYDKQLDQRWSLSSGVSRETKHGLKSIAGVIGNNGGNPRAIVLPEPVDYETSEANVALRYTDSRKQFELRYLASFFEDNNAALQWQNPFTAINGWQASAGFPNGFGQLALPPDNQFHQLSAASGYHWSNGMFLTADLAMGRMTQDDTFLPYTINPTIAAAITQGLPRTSLDGRIDTTVANLRLGGRPSGQFHWNFSARYDDRDNKTPRDEYVYIGGDSNLQNLAVNSANRRFNEPYSTRETRFKLDGGYRLTSKTLLGAAIEQRDTKRTFTERENADETLVSASLQQSANDWFSGALRWSRADRSGSTYAGNEPFLSGYSPGYTSTVPGNFENPPNLRRFYLADRIRDTLGGNLSFTPGELWSIAFDAQRTQDDYRHSELGLTGTTSEAYTVDVAFTPTAAWTSTAFYSRENLNVDQNGQSIGSATRVVDASNPARSWTALHRDRVDTAGAGLQWAAIPKRLDLGADYVYTRTRSQITVTTGSALTALPLPEDRTRLQSISIYGKYRLRTDLNVNLTLWRETYRSSDFALDAVEANQLANVILFGEESPDYKVNVVTLSLIYQFK